ncbi:hypothetical protein [Glaciibacter superstes]|uniref:hypothetical protein n=1 Tax=Glaciibacter superstes TaxID=501023 RepID=UPI000524F674|nr:hypothetical protein [Glaciibacter superstes]
MTQNQPAAPNQPGAGGPPRRSSSALSTAELFGLSGGTALFVGLVTLLTTREVWLSLVSLVIAFVVVLVVTALFARRLKPNADVDLNNNPR